MELLGSESAATAKEILLHNYFHIFAVSFLYYDHIITSGNEIDYLWKRPKSASAYWFFLNRYFAFFGNISVTVLGFTALSPQSCKQYSLFRQVLLIANQVLVCILLTLRIYALYGCSIRVLAYMVGSGAVLLGVSVWVLFGQKSAPAEQSSGCHIALSSETAIRLASAWEALFIYDTILFCLTLGKTWRARAAITRMRVSIIALILRDGAIYFAVMALANLANILTFYVGTYLLRRTIKCLTLPSSAGLSSEVASQPSQAGKLPINYPFTGAQLTSLLQYIRTMMSRLMLNLHETADIGIFSSEASTALERGPRFPNNLVELDTVRSGDLQHSPTAAHFGLDITTATTPLPLPHTGIVNDYQQPWYNS
ncbi:hypothetical protein BD779DRAFT_1788338 [Infundibulicybe gibba]|nr:hypothetical protein BD779DRAFT_1788338 [Infundibulicybe gibba]